MKLGAILRFEIACQLRSFWTWLVVAFLVVFAFISTRVSLLGDALRDDFFLNSPFVAAMMTVVTCMIWLLAGPFVAGDAGARDVETGMHPLVYAAPIHKAEYLGGRFLAAFILNASLLLMVQASILASAYLPGVDAEAIGPFQAAAYLRAFGFIALPNAFVATAIQFSLATVSGRPRASYLGSILLFFSAFIVGFTLGFLLGQRDLARLTDPIGLFTVTEFTTAWTPAEKRTRLLELQGNFLLNRVIWISVATAALVATYARFQFAHRTAGSWWTRLRRRRGAGASPASTAVAGRPIAVPQVAQSFGLMTHVRQALLVAGASFRSIATSKGGLAFLVGLPLFVTLILPGEMTLLGVPVTPVTAFVLQSRSVPPLLLIPLLVIILYAGELVWREREAGLGEMVDAAPVPEWVLLAGKFLGLTLVLAAYLTALTLAEMWAQARMGHHDFEPGLYLAIHFGIELPNYAFLGLLALVVHVVVNQKHVAHLLAVGLIAAILLAPVFGIDHHLLVPVPGPEWSYTEMRGFAPTLGPWRWFKAYWAAWALLLAVGARLAWVRGMDGSLRGRITLARGRLTRPTVWTAATAVTLALFLGGFIFYNTNVLNEYVSPSARTARQAEYERRFRRFEGIPQPAVAATALQVDIFPERRAATIRGSYRLVNRTGAALDSIHLAPAPQVETGTITFDRPARPVLAEDRLRYRIYTLQPALEPGDSLTVTFEVKAEPRGFRNSGIDPSISPNGTHFGYQWLPAIGYQRQRELTGPAERRKHGLAPRPHVLPALDDLHARNDTSGQGGMDFDAVVSTSEDQIAIAPGELRRTWTGNGRRYFHYVAGPPFGGEYAFFSAAYAVRRARWKDVSLEIYHHPPHTANVDRMMRALDATLDHHTRRYGPYPFSTIRLIEQPGTGIGMHAAPMTISYSEMSSHLRPHNRAIDLPFAIVTHEVAHQWWGHQVSPALVEGAGLLTESLAWYTGMRVVRETRGMEELRRLLRFQRQPYPYPPIRRGRPLLRGDDPYAMYRRGPFALHALSEYIGEDRVDAAVRALLRRFGAGSARRPTSLDFYRELQAVTPDSLQSLAGDLFERNMVWDLAVDEATARETASGWEVKLDIRARKLAVDTAGAETEVPLDDWVEVGVFAPVEDADELSAPLYLRKHRLRSGEQTITVTVPGQPALAGIDPHHLLDWEEREDDDNVEAPR